MLNAPVRVEEPQRGDEKFKNLPLSVFGYITDWEYFIYFAFLRSTIMSII